MATLTENLSIDGEIVTVNEPLIAGADYRIGEEAITARSALVQTYTDITDRLRWFVTRGVAGSTRATHLSGADLLGAGSALVSSETETPPAPWAGEGGGVQTVRLLGPFQFAFDDPLIDSEGKVLTMLPANSRIISTAIFAVEDFNSGADQEIDLEIGDSWNDVGVTYYIIKGTLADNPAGDKELDMSFQGTVTVNTRPRWTDATPLKVYFYPDGEVASGIAEVEVLIAEPAP